MAGALPWAMTRRLQAPLSHGSLPKRRTASGTTIGAVSYWGHYHSDGQIAEKDFAKRIDDYKELFQVQERSGSREPAEYYRYYSTQRPVDLGTFPKLPGNAPVEIINFDERRMVEGGTMRAWGELAYLKPLTEKQMHDYELRPAPGNPDRAARPSITAQLKETARKAEPPKEHDKTKHNKSREDR